MAIKLLAAARNENPQYPALILQFACHVDKKIKTMIYLWMCGPVIYNSRNEMVFLTLCSLVEQSPSGFMLDNSTFHIPKLLYF